MMTTVGGDYGEDDGEDNEGCGDGDSVDDNSQQNSCLLSEEQPNDVDNSNGDGGDNETAIKRYLLFEHHHFLLL